jgi:predicted DsbA family dithiol-disulfide isomerase
MNTAVAHLVSEFEQLSPEEQREFSAAIVHRAAQLDCGDITDEELTVSAARVFVMLDVEETSYLLKSPQNASRIKSAITQLDASKGVAGSVDLNA